MCEYEIVLIGSMQIQCLLNMKKCKSSENNKECEIYKEHREFEEEVLKWQKS